METRSVSFRIALATPPNQLLNDSRVLSDLVCMASEQKHVELKGGWDSIRQYQWGPVCIVKLLWAGYFGKSNLYNISGGEVVSLEELAMLIAKLFNAEYENNKHKSYFTLGAPEYVKVSSERLNSEANYTFPEEKLFVLLNVYCH
jgi:hypothetical protein